ncbi:hypothetical protein CIB95_06395 [Lottiidibacillus patelloidae]|uniref:Aminoglycoside phosphotransferase domain-containing protein n=1 Tax=Lottiidibacillus patelloidae TaxID=2670334 RepID=A0A263BWP0_9BACI|nr:RIO1 family regulatory kinase/ATPase [Lottiidibacillus patelloidae]OZM57982.1 hypothetical protein CIB95_06395 [Lottiidibacillus patelloidae]
MKLSEHILQSFAIKGEKVPLLGGQNTSVKVGNVVFKPIDDTVHYEWISSVIENLSPKGYRLAKPVRDTHGFFVNDGWICNTFESGQEKDGCVNEKLYVSRLFHQDLTHISVNNFQQPRNAWETGHQVAWQQEAIPEDISFEAKVIIKDLLAKVTLKNHYNKQIVHGDLSGNVLFHKSLPPLIIDFSPTVAPVEYAEAILVCDCIAWQGSMVSELNVLPLNDYYEMIIRAIVFRLTVAAIFSKNNKDNFLNEYECFKPIIDFVK